MRIHYNCCGQLPVGFDIVLYFYNAHQGCTKSKQSTSSRRGIDGRRDIVCKLRVVQFHAIKVPISVSRSARSRTVPATGVSMRARGHGMLKHLKLCSEFKQNDL